MYLNDKKIKKIVENVAKPSGNIAYFSGPQLVEVFRNIGYDDRYDKGIMAEGFEGCLSRGEYVKMRLESLNGHLELRDLLEKIINLTAEELLEEEKEEYIKCFKEVIEGDEYTIEKKSGKYRIKRSNEKEEDVNSESYFENIKGRILKEIEKAQITAWVSMAWFTDMDFLKSLYEAKKRGVSVRILISDNEKNEKLKEKLKEIFELYVVEVNGKYKKNMLHTKYCVIDSKVVITGSYNWSINAQYNKESVTIVENKDDAEKHMINFVENIPKEQIR